MTLFSVISIAKDEKELITLKKALSKQTFRDFELIYSTKPTIPEAWNDAITRSSGEYIVFIESDALPLNNLWLEEIAHSAEKGMLFKGLEINPTDLDLCNTICDSTILKREKFDVSFSICEDTELFARLRSKGITIQTLNKFPVIHVQSHTWNKTLSRSLLKGIFWVKIYYLYGSENMENINTRHLERQRINPISERIRIITENIMILIGEFLGLVFCIPLALKRMFSKKSN